MSKKRRRLAAADAVQLPAELWAVALDYLPFDDVLACSALSKVFRRDVTRQITHLCICSGDSMDVAPTLIDKFSKVTEVEIHFVQLATDGTHAYHLDVTAVEHAVPFLSRLPSLQRCGFGDIRSENGLRYRVDFEKKYDEPNPNEKVGELVRAVCNAYRTGELSEDVKLAEMPPVQVHFGCVWKRIPTTESYRQDVRCQLCDMICMSYPPAMVIGFNNCDVPCIKLEDRVRIARFRDEGKYKANMTKAFMFALQEFHARQMMCPPDFQTMRHAVQYGENVLDKMQFFTSNGAEINYSDFWNEMLHIWRDSAKPFFLGKKLVVMVATFRGLKGLGFDINEADCILMDENDPRTSCAQFLARKVKEKLEGGVDLVNIDTIRIQVKFVLKRDRNLFSERKLLQRVRDNLELLFKIDLSDKQNAIKLLVNELKEK